MPSKKTKKRVNDAVDSAMSKIPAPVPGSSFNILKYVQEKMTMSGRMTDKEKEMHKKKMKK